VSLPNSPNLAGTPGQPAPATQKQGTNIYTVMLMLTFVFIVTATVMLAMELNRFGSYPWWQTPGGGS
jgi:hypothetical protein